MSDGMGLYPGWGDYRRGDVPKEADRMKDPACKESGGCGGGGGDGHVNLCVSLDADSDFGAGVRTSINTNAYLFGAGYSLASTPGGTQGAVQTFQAGGTALGFSRGPSDVFTEGEGVAGHPAKWGYRPLRRNCVTKPVKNVTAVPRKPLWIIAGSVMFLIAIAAGYELISG